MQDDHFKPLPWIKFNRNVPCYLPKTAAYTPVDANSPALESMTDFRRVTPVTISRDVSLNEANKVMALCNVHCLLVVDAQRHLLGLVTEAGTKGHRPLAVAYKMGIRPSELTIGNVMIEKHDAAEVMHLTDVIHARVGNVLTTLKELSTPYCLVVDHDKEGDHVLCGLFSLAHIERQMGLESHFVPIAQTFSEIVSHP